MIKNGFKTSEIFTINQNYKVDSNYSAVHAIRQSRLVDPKSDSTLTYAVRIFNLSPTVFEKIGNNIQTDTQTDRHTDRQTHRQTLPLYIY